MALSTFLQSLRIIPRAEELVSPEGPGAEVRTGDDLSLARSTSIHPGRLVVHAQDLSTQDLISAVGFAAGHIVVGSAEQIDVLSAASERGLSVLLRTVSSLDVQNRRGFNSGAAARLLAHPTVRLAGLHSDIGSRDGAFVSFPAAIGQMIAELADIRRHYDATLIQVSVGVTPVTVDMDRMSPHIDAALHDACRTYGFPVPAVIVSTAPRRTGRSAA